jgi:hypothetical protein
VQGGDVTKVKQLLVDYAQHLPHLIPTADFARTFILMREMQVTPSPCELLSTDGEDVRKEH